MGTPKTTLSSTVTLNNGAISDAVIKVSNGSQGVWRHYTDASGNGAQDEQYKYKITGVSVKDINGNTVSNMTISSYPQGILDYGQSGEIKYSVSGVGTSGMVVRLDVDYIVYDEDGNTMLNGTVFTTSKYTYLSYNGTNSGSEHLTTDKHDVKPYVFSPYYIALKMAQTLYLDLTPSDLKTQTVLSAERALSRQSPAVLREVSRLIRGQKTAERATLRVTVSL